MDRYTIVSHRSKILVGVRATLQYHEIETSGLRGEFVSSLHADGGAHSGGISGRISLPAASLQTGNRLFDREMKRLLEARKYPEIAGEILELEEGAETGAYFVRGNLTLHGVTREVGGTARILEVGDSHVVIEGEMPLVFTEYDMEQPRLLMLEVTPEVEIKGTLYAERRP